VYTDSSGQVDSAEFVADIAKWFIRLITLVVVGGANDQVDASSLLISKIAQTLPKPHDKGRWIRVSKKQNANLRGLALPGEDREGPGRGRAAQQCDEIPALH
jgi:hypothetical protein